MHCWPAELRVTEMVSKMIKVVAAGLAPGSQGWVLAMPLPCVGSAAALALVLLQVCACNPRCWPGWLCGDVLRSLPCQTPAASTSWYNTGVWKPLEDLPPALYCSLGLYLPSHGQESISSQRQPQLHPSAGTDWIWVPEEDRLGIDKQVSALKEKRCSMFEAASLVNTQPWLSPLPTGFQMTAAGVIRALGSTVSEIITG